jgi:hypothetical protein
MHLHGYHLESQEKAEPPIVGFDPADFTLPSLAALLDTKDFLTVEFGFSPLTLRFPSSKNRDCPAPGELDVCGAADTARDVVLRGRSTLIPSSRRW